MNLKKARFFIFDVESIGLHGEGYAVAGGVYDGEGSVVAETEFCFSCPPGNAIGRLSDRDWVCSNVPPIKVTHQSPTEVREAFWKLWKRNEADHEAIMFAECGWPVEANFLAACVADNREDRTFGGPYPFHEISTVMACAGMDPLETYPRLENELPAHNPIGDARMSARLLATALDKIWNP